MRLCLPLKAAAREQDRDRLALRIQQFYLAPPDHVSRLHFGQQVSRLFAGGQEIGERKIGHVRYAGAQQSPHSPIGQPAAAGAVEERRGGRRQLEQLTVALRCEPWIGCHGFWVHRPAFPPACVRDLSRGVCLDCKGIAQTGESRFARLRGQSGRDVMLWGMLFIRVDLATASGLAEAVLGK